MRPAPRRQRSIRPQGEESPPVSDRAAGVIGEGVKVMGHVKPVCRRAVFGRRVMAFQFQCWRLGDAKKMCEQLAPLLTEEADAVERWLQQPFVGERPFPLSCKGRKVAKPPVQGMEPVQDG